MKRKKILWFSSWYPNRIDPFDGDFIQRHARAAAIHHDIHVIFATPLAISKTEKVKTHSSAGLVEELVYYPAAPVWMGGPGRHWAWLKAMRSAAASYVNEFGVPDLIHVHIPWKAGLIGQWFSHKFKVRYLVSEHWGIYDREKDGQFLKWNGWKQSLAKDILFRAAAVVTVSRYLADTMYRATGIETSVVIPNVVDTTLFHAGPEKYQRFSFIHVSNMEPVKQVDQILKAFAELLSERPQSNVQLILIGNRDDKYLHLAEQMGLLNSRIFFRHEIPYPEVAGEMRRCHCLVMASRSETFSCVTAEAVCSGVPVVAPAVGALPEIVSEGRGILYESGGVGELKSAMKRMLHEYETYNPMGMSRTAGLQFGYGAVADQFKNLYSRF